MIRSLVLFLALTAAMPRRELHRMVEGRMPRLRLREMTLGLSLDYLVRGAAPASSGYVICSTSVSSASWQSPATCGLATGTNYWSLVGGILEPTSGYNVEVPNGGSSSSPRVLGWTTWASGNYEQLKFGDDGTAIQAGYGQRMQLVGYGGIALYGAQGSAAQLAFEAQGSTADWALEIHTGGTKGLRVDGSTQLGTNGTPISGSYEVTTSSVTVSVSPSTCAAIWASAGTFITLGSECSTSATATDGTRYNLDLSCGATAAGTVALYACNATTATQNISAKSWKVRYWNP